MAERTEHSILSLVTANRLVKTKRNLCEIKIVTRNSRPVRYTKRLTATAKLV